MSENKQLVRKNNGGGYNNVYPYSYTETVKDKKTGKSLEEILVSTNFLYLPYRDSKAATRLQVDERYRRKGLWVQYVTDLGSVIVEYYNSSDISDTKWADDKYWAPYNSAQFNPGTIGLDALSQEAKDYLLTNSPVNTEDITRDNQSRLQLADRAYNPASFSGKGYKILRQNILNGSSWITYDNVQMGRERIGNTTSRPSSGIYIGFQYFDTDLNKPIWWIGSRWVDATGATV